MGCEMKQKQGRPRFDDELLRQVQSRFPNVKTRFGQQKLVYTIKAYNLLRDLPELDFFWVFDKAGKRKDMKRSLLAEIGRFKDPELIRKVGSRVCEEQKHQPKSVEEWTKMLRAVRLEKNLALFLSGKLTNIPCLVLRQYPHPGLGLVGLGTLLELSEEKRTHVTAPIYGKMPEGWQHAELLADDAVPGYNEWAIGKAGYTALFRTSQEFFKVFMTLDAPRAEVTVLGSDLQNPPSKVRELYDYVLPNTKSLRLRPMTAGDMEKELTIFGTRLKRCSPMEEFEYQQRRKELALREAIENFDPLTYLSKRF